VALRMPLLEMYVPLKARIEMPEGETWSRELRLAGRQVSPEEAEVMGRRLSEPQPLLELLKQHEGLIILGDPGAGKTTFLKYLTLRLALGQGESLNLGHRLPILVPLSAYANALDSDDTPLDEFVAAYYRQRGIKLPIEAMLTEALERGGVLLLLDGLDEVRGLGRRRLVVDRVVDFFTLEQQKGNKFILTSRIVGYREVRPIVEGLAECTLVDFDKEEINQFVEQWTGALERAARGDTPVAAQEAATERAELLDAIDHNPGVRQLAANPLLLT
ncbi:MAG: NACHT domain-containing protein, partial [bacterium]|nr:NACHT domain-containing protein [bacterium]